MSEEQAQARIDLGNQFLDMLFKYTPFSEIHDLLSKNNLLEHNDLKVRIKDAERHKYSHDDSDITALRMADLIYAGLSRGFNEFLDINGLSVTNTPCALSKEDKKTVVQFFQNTCSSLRDAQYKHTIELLNKELKYDN